jgi:hypothetical protein
MGHRIDHPPEKRNETPRRKIFASLYRRRGVGVSHLRALGPLSRHDHDVSPRRDHDDRLRKRIGDRPAELIRGCVDMGPMGEKQLEPHGQWPPWSQLRAARGLTS